LLDSSTQGSVWLSGGRFGAEASATTVLICLALAAFFTRRAIVEGHIRPPFWRRAKAPEAAVSIEPATANDAPPSELSE
jgi:hypothetical protein